VAITPDESMTTAQGRHKRVLFIEDDPDIGTIVQEFLAAYYSVEVIPDGGTGLASITAARPDVLLLDINMPGMNGLEVLRHVRGIDPTIPVIMVSATGDDFAIATALMRGAFAYVPKPINWDYLLHLISAALPRERSGGQSSKPGS
jgi:DNA-binding response OmpR family regulator